MLDVFFWAISLWMDKKGQKGRVESLKGKAAAFK